ncbi:ornithine carbamoyltransferase [Marine Group I thaumarchaeote]|jgi:ornithine carbamoyltransferase|uniref:Ornithine carbamoyltransferase n=2 Tax=Nitrososphaerota TaxID=651137 RepID=A0A7K4MM80_9ARCH|nr:putative aspartate/ornithine carbamoyltransferase, carbamoyl-P binding domain protein [uncultured marine crenarchaeote HF4000_APKG8G2]NWJ42673.1 ornithine carbamoyltransferase [Marine Group I thaumarchaeote]NWJ99188.1 ornithine carbamoyltransferase [Marine Group I thaumarchaeote]RTZ70999.1 MAG: ornithine carbamoyltransferase [Nitrososphaerota archaeon]
MKLKTKDLLTVDEISSKEFLELIDFSIKLKKENKTVKEKPLLKNKTLAMLFEKPSTRTRVSFEIGMLQLGGHTVNLSLNEMQHSRGESVEDTAKTLSRYVDAIVARVYEHSFIEKLAKHATVPVINGLSNSYHPCQTLADLMTIKEHKKKFKDLKIAWIGDGNNVCNSLIFGCSKTQTQIVIATPKGFEPNPEVVKKSSKYTVVDLTTDPKSAVKDADIVMTDTFTSIHMSDPKRTEKFLPSFQVNDSLMEKAKNDAIFMHCLPAKREQEVTSSVIDGPQSVVWDEAENRLHTQKALLLSLLSI